MLSNTAAATYGKTRHDLTTVLSLLYHGLVRHADRRGQVGGWHDVLTSRLLLILPRLARATSTTGSPVSHNIQHIYTMVDKKQRPVTLATPDQFLKSVGSMPVYRCVLRWRHLVNAYGVTASVLIGPLVT